MNGNLMLKTKPGSLIGLFVTVSMILAACTAAVQTSQPTQVSTPASSSGEATINVATDSTLGQILVDGKGMSLYMFTVDDPDKSNCDAACLEKWPPLLTLGSPKAGPGVDQSMLGSSTLADGRMIVTYNHMPLYYWYKDTKPGDTTGQGVGSVWYVVAPDGSVIGNPNTSSPGAAATEPTLNVATDAKYGPILVDDKGMTLYIFTRDERDKSNCDASCLEKWPPLLTEGGAMAGPGVDSSKIGTVALADGRTIVTYDHRPLYYWYQDTKAGDTLGQDVGGVWYVISPSGQEIDESPEAVADPTPPASSAGEPTINVASNPTLGQFLVDGNGMTLYIFTRDTADQSNCTGDCLVAWPPLLTQGAPILGAGVDDSKIGSAPLPDGTLIVTYNHMPLYFYFKDINPGDTTGQGVGSVWYVINPDGEIIGQ